MKKRLTIFLLALLALVFTAPVLAQEAQTFTPFSDDAFGIQGIIPEGWVSIDSGIYAPSSSSTTPTFLALQTAPVSSDRFWAAVLPQFGLETVPEAVGTLQTDAFKWTLYQFDGTQGGIPVRVSAALAERNNKTVAAFLISAPDEAEAMHDALFMPVVNAVAPLAAADLPYNSEEVTFSNGDITLAGTLTLPQTNGRHPAIVLMTGSGQQDRDEQVIPGYRLFEQIADALTRQGIAVLRYDDRGIGGSTGDYSTASIQDLATDGKAAVAYLRSRADIDPDQVGVLGHSEGGVYASILGADPDSGVAFIISVAGTAALGTEVLLRQNELILRTSGANDAMVDIQLDMLRQTFPLVEARDWDAAEQVVYESVLKQWAVLSEAKQTALGGDAETYARQTAASVRQNYDVEWYRSGLTYNPADDWAKTTVPVLAIFGGLDVQVDAVQNAPPMQAALTQAGNRDTEIVVLPTANHLLQSAVTGSLEEYAQLSKQLTPDLMPTITDWLLRHVKTAV